MKMNHTHTQKQKNEDQKVAKTLVVSLSYPLKNVYFSLTNLNKLWQKNDKCVYIYRNDVAIEK